MSQLPKELDSREKNTMARLLVSAVLFINAAAAFSPGATGMPSARSPVLRTAPIRMCTPPDLPTPAAGVKQSVLSKAITLISAICIGSIAPSPSRAGQFSPETFAAVSGDSGSLVVKDAVDEALAQEGKSLRSYGAAVAAGASGFVSVYFLRKGGRKDPPVQDRIKSKQDECTVGPGTVSTVGDTSEEVKLTHAKGTLANNTKSGKYAK